MTSNRLTVVDLFSGAGGLSLGFEKAGFQSVLAIDHMIAAVETFKDNHHTPVTCEEIEESIELPASTLIIGGPPCQGFSSAGRRQEGDHRNTLVSVFGSLIARDRPEMFVFENVEGFLTMEKGARVHDLLEPLLEAGYRIHLRKINAANYDVPQHRKRVIAIGALSFDPSFPEPTHSAYGAPGAHLAGMHLPETPTITKALANLPEPTDSPPGTPSDHYTRPLNGNRGKIVKALGPGQTMRDLPEEFWHNSYQRRAYRRVKDGTPTERRGGPPAGVRRLAPNEPSKAITGGASGEFVHPTLDHFLTLRECARLQTFPDDFTFFGTRSERALLIGNAVPPHLAEALAASVLQDLKEAKRRKPRKGKLLSFVPTLSTGMSPALAHVTETVRERFNPPENQLGLFA